MTIQPLEAHKVTTPIQLLALWLVGLVAVSGSFLAAAANLTSPLWAKGALVLAAIVNVPLFLSFLFALQTRFRPQMQEDAYYAKYLEANMATSERRDDFRPFDISEELREDQLKAVETRAKRLHPTVATMEYSDFFTLHTWYFDKDYLANALTCIMIALSKEPTSKAYSYCAANLRVMGRWVEAKAMARLALKLDPTNIDAHFNLAVVNLFEGERNEAQDHVRAVLESDLRSTYERELSRLLGTSAGT